VKPARSGSLSHPRRPSDVLALYPAIVDRLTGGEYRAEAHGVTFRCPFIDRHKHGDRHWSARAWIGAKGELVCRCLGCRAGWAEFVRQTGLTTQAFWPSSTHWSTQAVATAPPPQAVARYVYRHADGTEYGTKTRWEPGYHGRPKSFTWSRPVPADVRLLCGLPADAPAVIDGKDAMAEGWFVAAKWADGYHLRATDAETDGAVLVPDAGPPPLYRLPELLAAPSHRGACVVEGEKACESLRMLGFVAVCPPNGASTWLPEYAACFAGRDVILLPDNDPAGRGLMETAAGLLLFNGGVKSLRVLAAPADGYLLGDGGDVADWMAEHRHLKTAGLAKALWAVAETLPVYRREVPRAAA
jgi:hypothetical protein